MPVIVNVPATIVNVVQSGLLKRGWHDSLYPALMFRNEASEEEWEGNTGVEIVNTRRGLLTPTVAPLQPGVDPIPQNPVFEQWIARLEHYGATMDVDVPTAAAASGDLFMSDVKSLGLQAGQSVNRLARNAICKSYLGGHTVLIAAAAAGDATIRVAACNGFTDIVIPGTTVRPVPVSPLAPLSITIAGVTGTRGVIGAAPDDPTDPDGPGTLLLDAVIGGAGAALRAAVLSSDRPAIIRAGGGLSIDAIGASDIITLQDLNNAVTILRINRVPPHEDGTYHAHFAPQSNAQIFADPSFQRLNTGLPDHSYYQEAFIGRMLGCECGLNPEAPDQSNVGALTATGASSFYGRDIGAEVTNGTGVNVARVLVTGRGAMYERYLDESKQYVTEAGLTGKQGEFQVTNAGVVVDTRHIRLIVRAPVDRFQRQVALTWSLTTAFPIPSDRASGNSARFKRAVMIEHARD